MQCGGERESKLKEIGNRKKKIVGNGIHILQFEKERKCSSMIDAIFKSQLKSQWVSKLRLIFFFWGRQRHLENHHKYENYDSQKSHTANGLRAGCVAEARIYEWDM